MNHIKNNPDIYIVQVRYKRQEYFFPWDADTQNFVSKQGEILFFLDTAVLKDVLHLQESTISDRTIVYDLDSLLADNPTPNTAASCSLQMDIWNFFSDFCNATNQSFLGDCRQSLVNQVYDKLFYGCNILATDTNKEYHPHWNSEERLLLKQIFSTGLENFVKWVEKTCKQQKGSSLR